MTASQLAPRGITHQLWHDSITLLFTCTVVWVHTLPICHLSSSSFVLLLHPPPYMPTICACETLTQLKCAVENRASDTSLARQSLRSHLAVGRRPSVRPSLPGSITRDISSCASTRLDSVREGGSWTGPDRTGPTGDTGPGSFKLACQTHSSSEDLSDTDTDRAASYTACTAWREGGMDRIGLEEQLSCPDSSCCHCDCQVSGQVSGRDRIGSDCCQHSDLNTDGGI